LKDPWNRARALAAVAEVLAEQRDNELPEPL
jgi:hypothetical protein